MTASMIKDIIALEIDRRNLSIRDFARLVGVSHPTISAILNGDKPSYDLCVKIAPIIHMPLEETLRASGLLPKDANEGIRLQRFYELVKLLDDDDLQDLEDLARAKLERQGKGQEIETAESRKKVKPPALGV